MRARRSLRSLLAGWALGARNSGGALGTLRACLASRSLRTDRARKPGRTLDTLRAGIAAWTGKTGGALIALQARRSL